MSKALINISGIESEKESHQQKKTSKQKSKKNRIKKKKSSHNENTNKKPIFDPSTVTKRRKQSCYLKGQNEVKNALNIKIINDLQKKSKEKIKLKNINNKNYLIDKELFKIKTSKNVEVKKTEQKKPSNEENNSPTESILSDDESSNSSLDEKESSKNVTIENNNNINTVKKEKYLKLKNEKEKSSILRTSPGNNKKENKKNSKPKITIIISKNNYINNDKEVEDINTHRHKKKINKDIDSKRIRKKKRSSTLKYKTSFKGDEKKKKIPTNKKIHSTNKIGKVKRTKSFNLKNVKKNDEKKGEESDSEGTNEKNSKKRLKKVKKKSKNKNSKKKEKKNDEDKLNVSNYSSKSSIEIKKLKTEKTSLFSKDNKLNSKKEVTTKIPNKEKTIETMKINHNPRNSIQIPNATNKKYSIATPVISCRRTMNNSTLTKIVEESAKIVESRLTCPNEGPNIVPFTNITSVTLDYKEYKEYTLNCLEAILDLEKEKKDNNLSQINFNFSGEELNKKKIALFDIDETLIHCTGNIKIKGNVPHQKEIMINLPNNQKVKVGINVRPFWQEALDMLIDKYNIAAFTASHQAYADSVLDAIDPKKKYFKYRLYRNNCASTEMNGSKLYIKDLDIFKDNYDLKDIVIIDNSVLSFAYHLNNGIPIVPYYEGTEDKYLLSIAIYLAKIWNCDDLREKNKKLYNLEKWKDEIAQDIENKKGWSSNSDDFVFDPNKEKEKEK